MAQTGQEGQAGKLVGYARVSTASQDHALQLDALHKAGVQDKYLYTDKASGKLTARPGLDKALAALKPGDKLVVWKLDRLGRSLIHLITVVNELGERGVQFASLTEGFDTSTPGGELVFHIMGALAQFERRLIQERTMAGLAVAAANGHRGGRRPALTDEQAAQARTLHAVGTPVAGIARALGVSRPTVYRALEDDQAGASAAPVVSSPKKAPAKAKAAASEKHAPSPPAMSVPADSEVVLAEAEAVEEDELDGYEPYDQDDLDGVAD